MFCGSGKVVWCGATMMKWCGAAKSLLVVTTIMASLTVVAIPSWAVHHA